MPDSEPCGFTGTSAYLAWAGSAGIYTLEVTLVSARNLPKRGRLLSKLFLCDPWG